MLDFKFIVFSGSDILMDVGNSLNPAIDIGQAANPERGVMEMGNGFPWPGKQWNHVDEFIDDLYEAGFLAK